MDSGTLTADNLREKLRWGNGNKVYTRKFHNKGLKNTAATSATAGATTDSNINNGTNKETATTTADNNNSNPIPQTVALVTEKANSQTLATEEANSPQQQQETNLSQIDVVSVDSSSHNCLPEVAVSNGHESPSGNGTVEPVKPVVSRVDNRVNINLAAARSKDEIRELRLKLVSELDQVRTLVKKLEAKEAELTAYSTGDGDGGAYSHSQHSANEGNENEMMIDRRALVRVNSEMQSTNDGIDRRALVRLNSDVQHDDVIDRRALVRVNSEVQYDSIDRRALMQVNSEMGSANDFIDRRALMRVNSEVGSVGHYDVRSFQHLSVSVMENNHGVAEYTEREKRTPKANQFYRNSDFLLGKDRLPPESKKSKSNGGRKQGGDMDYGFGMDRYRNQVFKACGNLLQRLMKHKHGWVFNEPVNAKALGLHDYHDIIKQPMDLGTIKSKLSQNLYKSPREFAEDVRLTFFNAMTYNPKGQDVHVMAEQLSNIFEERWSIMEIEYNTDLRYDTIHDAGLPTPTSRKAAPPPLTPQMRTLDRWESMTTTVNSRVKSSNFGPVSRTPAPKKPKAKDPNKRDMTYEEKQRLSTNLQSLPSEKLDNIVQIIKKGSSDLCQHDDEIEVDIDSVNAETLWELDRFVTNYKKSLSKSKRKAEIAQARAEARLAMQAMVRVLL